MLRNSITSNEVKGKSNLETEELRILKLIITDEKELTEHQLIAKWKILKHMQSELELPSDVSIFELLALFKKFEEIRNTFGLETINFKQLNEILINIVTVKDMLDFPSETSISEIVSNLIFRDIANLGLGENSLLEKLLLLYRCKTIQ
ncbi:MAG: hypothetical protein EAX86_05550 [Candidatus Heimdallarchaeota archaeon]|nr:hypothetical protein [Candidatus Heimdallarchaeota archaeon]